MNDCKNLWIFIDGLRYDNAIKYLSFLNGENTVPVKPGIGFSNNIYPELICGLVPDEIGYFNEWSPKSQDGAKLHWALRFLDIFRNSLYINVGIRKIILKRLFGLNYSNIPFKYAHLFKPQGSHDFRDIENGSLLKAKDFKIYDSVEIRAGVGARDTKLLKDLVEEDLTSNTFISLVDIDNIQHIYGVGSTEVLSHLNMLSRKLTTIIEKFRKTNPKANVCLFSDHGMVNVNRKVDFQLDQHFWEMDSSFMYFIDSTICRIWVKAKDKKEEIHKFLEIQDFGQVIGETERKEYGISNLDYGDIIFRANEGVMFVPNFYGARINKAMHGYSSELESQQAFFSDIFNTVGQDWPNKTVDVHTYLKAVVE